MWLVTGANGQLGSELKSLLSTSAVYMDRAELDISDELAVKVFLKRTGLMALSIALPIQQSTRQKMNRPRLTESIISGRNGWRNTESALSISLLTMYSMEPLIFRIVKMTDPILFPHMEEQNWLGRGLFWNRRKQPLLSGRHGFILYTAATLSKPC